MSSKKPDPLFRKVDCVQIPVPDLEAALLFYRDKLGHALVWRTESSAGLRMPDSDAEILLETRRTELEPDLLVESADLAAVRVAEAGGRIVMAPVDILVGRCAVVEDPFGNRLVLLDLSKGRLVTDDKGRVVGVSKE